MQNCASLLVLTLLAKRCNKVCSFVGLLLRKRTMAKNSNKSYAGNRLSFPDIEELSRGLVTGRRLLGLDPGTKTLGIAISDSLHNIATPLETLQRGKFADDAARIATIIKEHDICAIVMGLPLNMDGSTGPRVQSVRAFARNLAPLLKLPICFWDERLSTVAVERTLLEADASRKKRSEVIDKMAAGYILQGALDRISQIRAQNG